jgi:murein DD-endopeptidase MepM/ murein hydrolase activator NlpD
MFIKFTNKFLGLMIFTFGLIINILAQSPYQEGYYLFPINPNQRNYFAGTPCELRGSHFHAGLDVKTGNITGLPIRAAADGYISRVKVSSTGYGLVLYLTHPNKQSTVYAHLERFMPTVAEFVLQEQYKIESFAIDINLDEYKFPVKKGDVIAWSGNSGSSSSPHLHFEIRTDKDVPLDVVKFKFSEIADNVPPIVNFIAIQPLDIRGRVEKQFAKKEYEVVKSGKRYGLTQKVKAIGAIGLEINMYDMADASSNEYGVNHACIEVNGKKVYEHHLDAIPFDLNRYIHTFTDYEYWVKNRRKLQRLYMLPSNKALNIVPEGFINQNQVAGILDIKAGEQYEVKLTVGDSFGNQSEVSFVIVGDNTLPLVTEPLRHSTGFEVNRNILRFTYPHNPTSQKIASVYSPMFSYPLLPSYSVGNQDVYLWNLNKGIPDSIVMTDKTVLKPDIKLMVLPEKATTFYHEVANITFNNTSLFDTLYWQMNFSEDTLVLQNSFVPLRSSISVSYKPQGLIVNKDKAQVYLAKNRDLTWVGGEWKGEIMHFRTNELGKFVLGYDLINPKITLLKKSDEVSFYIQDKESGIKSYKATLNGKWLMMKYDAKDDYLESERQIKTQALKGKFILEVEDNAGNKSVFERVF